IDAIEPEVAEFQRIDEHIDRANRIALVDPIVEAFRQQRRLLAGDPPLERNPSSLPPTIQSGNHSIDRGFYTAWTQSGSGLCIAQSRNIGSPWSVQAGNPDPIGTPASRSLERGLSVQSADV